MNINPETGELVSGRSPRFTLWIAFLVFATITMGSAVGVVSQVVLQLSSMRIHRVYCVDNGFFGGLSCEAPIPRMEEGR
jgi:hypothetical protein